MSSFFKNLFYKNLLIYRYIKVDNKLNSNLVVDISKEKFGNRYFWFYNEEKRCYYK